ncbi:coenzyme F420-reducing hydrogenase beta subunit [Catenibacillus scindens]|uniref:Coenzyme F420-reducing hydrogenase beta subunit n=1 Tax=Catenibacillus scindens TaxID=673271 RepID=A0A7W8M4T8_9FIRM|nr:Coenzyme F420 hydrogenase/dehydrogenase, beta subunit C-terminal domain [Catenibacillus scindens]MBB5264174.1 coenzyme F420-reducing hydrogenase beta subunit [Catenibacillus scindens]
MLDITDKLRCCGCTSCANVCANGAIKMLPDEEGFLYPVVDKNLCNNCGLCNNVCPVENKPLQSEEEKKSYVTRAKNENVLMDSTSGGFVTPLITYVLERNGIICAAAYDENFKVKHIIIEKDWKADDLANIRGSKYVQSDLGNCYKKIRKYLEEERTVCFVGTPCQVNGLKSFLRKSYTRLITVDLVCHGTPSPKLWEKYLNYQREKYSPQIKKISFRNKTYGYHSGTMKISFANRKPYFGSARVDLMLKCFFSEIASRPICYQCPFKTLDRCSDFTIYDCWHASDLVDGLKDDDKGFTNVIVQSKKGEDILDLIKDKYDIYSVETKKAIKLDGIMVLNSAVPHPLRSQFYIALDKYDMKEIVQKFVPIKINDYIIERLKVIIYHMGIYRAIVKIAKK